MTEAIATQEVVAATEVIVEVVVVIAVEEAVAVVIEAVVEVTEAEEEEVEVIEVDAEATNDSFNAVTYLYICIQYHHRYHMTQHNKPNTIQPLTFAF